MITNVIICNQNLSISHLNSILEKLPDRKVICSSHEFFKSEVKKFSSIALKDTTFTTFSDFFTDSDLWKIDEQALNMTRKIQPVPGKGGYSIFKNEMLNKKSEQLLELLRIRYGNIRLLVNDGLGIPSEWWKKNGALIIEPKNVSELKFNIWIKIKNLYKKWKATSCWREIYFPEKTVVLVSNTYRILSKINATTMNVPIWKRIIMVGTNNYIFPYPSSYRLGCTFHEKIASRRPLLVLQDGHLPSNYSYGHLWEYEDNCEFVPSNQFSDNWFKKSNRLTHFISGFNDHPMSKVATSTTITNTNTNNILIALNHAGDWTALINRSDTCKMIKKIIHLASTNGHLNIRIRCHPTMTLPDHEGPNSYNRILKEINTSGIKSISISTQSLEADLSWANLVISEYSQILIDSWKIGKLGISLNITNRRSFMQDYVNMGFKEVNSVESINSILNNSIYELINNQNSAVEAFNSSLFNWKNISASKPLVNIELVS